ncbi:MAG: patatin-like phospholipase family protein, partial [Bacteroidetes bacterium]|nr:patatin-like phospholipase family protein [Bacteroidota bacterium]
MDSDVSRVLILGGGGNRGYAQSRWLRKWKSVYGINQPLYQIFNTIACTSIGAINGACIGLDKSFDEIESLFLSKAKRIFTSRTAAERTLFSRNASKDSYVVTDAEKLLLLINNEPFYQSPY